MRNGNGIFAGKLFNSSDCKRILGTSKNGCEWNKKDAYFVGKYLEGLQNGKSWKGHEKHVSNKIMP